VPRLGVTGFLPDVKRQISTVREAHAGESDSRRIPVFVAEKLAEDEEIAFNADSHAELIRLSYKDFERLVQPAVARLSKGS
jgi:hypothetical protein